MKNIALGFTAIMMASATVMHAETVYSVATHSNNYAEYVEFTENFDPNGTEPIPGEGLWRHMMEHLVFVRALRLGGCDCRVEIVETEADLTFARAVEEIETGRIISFPAATFINPAIVESNGIMLSDPVIGEQDFYVGLYTHESRSDILDLTDLDAIRDLRFVVGATWATDLAVLKERGFTIVEGAEWTSMLKMLAAGRADVIMQPFSGKGEMSFTDVNVEGRFLPIPNVKMSFPFSRHYMVSAEHPDGQAFLAALNNGLEALRQSGELRRLLIASGVINPLVEDLEEL